MKKIVFILVCASALLVACSKEEIKPEPNASATVSTTSSADVNGDWPPPDLDK